MKGAGGCCWHVRWPCSRGQHKRLNPCLAIQPRRHSMPDRMLIVGAGPTGLTAAPELARIGIPVRIIVNHLAPPRTAPAVGLPARTRGAHDPRGPADAHDPATDP